MVMKSLQEDTREKNPAARALRIKAGHKPLLDTRPALVIAKAKLGPSTRAAHKKRPIITMERAFNGHPSRS